MAASRRINPGSARNYLFFGILTLGAIALIPARVEAGPGAPINQCSNNSGYWASVGCFNNVAPINLAAASYNFAALTTPPYQCCNVAVAGVVLQVFNGAPCQTGGARVGFAQFQNVGGFQVVNSFFVQNVRPNSSLVLNPKPFSGTAHSFQLLSTNGGTSNNWQAYIDGSAENILDIGSTVACIAETGMIIDKTSGRPASAYTVDGGDSRSFTFLSPQGGVYHYETQVHNDFPCGTPFCFNSAHYSGNTIFQYNIAH